MQILISKILNYEQSVFNEYNLKREKLRKYISKIKTNKINKKKLLVFINDIKTIIDPVKTSTENIDYFFTNKKFKKNENVDFNKLILIYFLLRPFFSSTDDSELDDGLSEETDESSLSLSDSLSDSESDSVSLSESEV